MDSRTFILTNFNNQNIHKMKTRNVNYNRSILNAFFIVFIVILSGCGSGGSKSGSDEKQQAEQQTAVKPPAVDIFTAAFLGDLDAVEQHIQAGTDLNQREPTMGSTPLISAAVFGKTEVARALMEAGADVNIQNQEGSTALHTAAFLCRTEIVELLLAHGADKDLQNIYGSTPLASVEGPFSEVKEIYDEFSRELGPMGLKLEYKQLEETRPLIAEMLR
jgi:hypothetical protein